MSATDWTNAEALAAEYLRTQKNASEPITFRRFDGLPYLFSAWWSAGTTDEGASVLVYDGNVQIARGIAALAAYFKFLGEVRLQALPMDLLEHLLAVFEASRPPEHHGAWHRGTVDYQDLHPKIVGERRLFRRVLKYVVHFVFLPPLPPGVGGSKLPGPLVLERWSLQLVPPARQLEWTMEGRVERPRPPVRV